MNDLRQARQDAELGFLQQSLSESDVQSHIIERSDAIPITVLLVPLMKDHRQRDRYLNISYVPLDDEDLDEIDLLQLYVTVPVEWSDGTNEHVEKLLNAVNGKLAIGHFQLTGAEVSYRYVHCTSSSERLPLSEAVAIIRLFELMLNLFSSKIDDVASGKASLSDSLDD